MECVWSFALGIFRRWCLKIVSPYRYCYIPIPQVNSVSASVHLVTFPQMQTVVRYFTKCMPPCSLQISLPIISCNNPSPLSPLILAHLMSMDFVTTPLSYALWHSWNSLAWSYYPDDLSHHMFVSVYHMFVSLSTWYFGFIILLSYEAHFLSYISVSSYLI